MAWEYSEKTKQLFLDAVHGKPGTHMGEIENPDGFGEHGSIACGDSLRFTFRVERNEEDATKDKIVEARYLTFGCTSAIAASEALCIILEARQCTPIEALKITNQDIVDFLEGLPDQKIHCSVMGAEALDAAVFDWARKRGVSLEKLGVDIKEHEEEEEGRIVCKCFSVTEPYLRRKIKELNLHTIPEITAAIKAGGACMNCHHAPGGLQDILDEIWGDEKAQSEILLPVWGQDTPATPTLPTPAAQTGEGLSPYQFAKKVESAVEKFIRPILQRDGGDCEIIDIKGNLVYVQLKGACESCVGANATLKMIVESTLRAQVQDDIRVIQI
ncbi:MAG: iron-sulfur cluster assembly scaffold protein [Planctomycetia bacterium]|nr:iron-sulfur cluster assembly scaffold protein [Planctomycetia bacterium]